MRRRRAVLFDDDAAVLGALTAFFRERDYEVIACSQPVRCPVYDEDAPCDQIEPCGDLMITDIEMPRMNGIEMLEAMARQGCRMDVRHKAVLSGNIDPDALEAIGRLGCAWFKKPFRIAQLEPWVRECESRMDLERPLGIKRKERRESCCSLIQVSLGASGAVCSAEVVNRSGSGCCLRIDRPLEVTQVLDVLGGSPAAPARVMVRWLRQDAGGAYLAGASRS